MTNKNIVLIVIGIILFGIWMISLRNMKIAGVEDGATIKLNNGAKVTLIGIEPTIESKEMLNDMVGEAVEVVPDRSQNFNSKKMEKNGRYHAYVLLKRGGHLNAMILSSGASLLNTAPPLNDSLCAFKRFERKEDNREQKNDGEQVVIPEPTPEPKKVINYEEDDIILPPYEKTERKECRWYIDGNKNIAMLEDACDYNLPYTKSFANRLAANSPGTFSINQVCDIFDYCFNKWRYVNDPKDIEYVARASESIAASLTGDCDDFAVLLASCILAVGGEVCINLGFNPTDGHAFTEVNIAQWNYSDVLKVIRKKFPAYQISSLQTRKDGNKVWLNLDWQAAYPGGPYYNCSSSRECYPFINGHWTWVKLW